MVATTKTMAPSIMGEVDRNFMDMHLAFDHLTVTAGAGDAVFVVKSQTSQLALEKYMILEQKSGFYQV